MYEESKEKHPINLKMTNLRAFPSGVHDVWRNFLSYKSFQQLNSQMNIFRQYFFLYHDFFIFFLNPHILSFLFMYYYHFISFWGVLLCLRWIDVCVSQCCCDSGWTATSTAPPAVPITPLPSQDEACRLHHIICSSISTPSWLIWSCHPGISQLECRSRCYLWSGAHSPKYDLKLIQFTNTIILEWEKSNLSGSWQRYEKNQSLSPGVGNRTVKENTGYKWKNRKEMVNKLWSKRLGMTIIKYVSWKDPQRWKKDRNKKDAEIMRQ